MDCEKLDKARKKFPARIFARCLSNIRRIPRARDAFLPGLAENRLEDVMTSGRHQPLSIHLRIIDYPLKEHNACSEL